MFPPPMRPMYVVIGPFKIQDTLADSSLSVRVCCLSTGLLNCGAASDLNFDERHFHILAGNKRLQRIWPIRMCFCDRRCADGQHMKLTNCLEGVSRARCR